MVFLKRVSLQKHVPMLVLIATTVTAIVVVTAVFLMGLFDLKSNWQDKISWELSDLSWQLQDVNPESGQALSAFGDHAIRYAGIRSLVILHQQKPLINLDIDGSTTTSGYSKIQAELAIDSRSQLSMRAQNLANLIPTHSFS